MKRFTQPLAFVLISLLWISNAMNSSSLMAQSPQISISPDTVHAWLNTCGDSTTQTLSITNNGSSPLLFNILQSGSFTEGFEDGLSNWNKTGTWGTTTASAYEGLYSVTESPGGYYPNNWSNYIVMKDSMIITDKDSAILSFYERHFLECNYDYLYVQLSVNNGAFVNLGNQTCSNSVWTNRQYNLSGLVNNGDYIKIRFFFYSDYSYTFDGVYVDKIRLGGVGSMVSWMSLPITLGIVQPGETMNLDMIFHSLLKSGLYSSLLRIQTNDPNLPVVIVPFYLHFDGYPVMGVVEDYLDYGQIMQNTTLKDTAYITNSGCDVLVVSSIYSDQPEFTPLITTFTLAPGLQKAIPVEFHPTVAGTYGAGIYFESNDTIIGSASPVFTVAGSSFAAPEINTEPDTIFITLSCGDSATVPVTISNAGGSDLHLQLSANTSTEGLVLYYPMDGSANDQSGNNLNGTIYGASPAPDRLNRPGMALSFDGINDYIDLPDAVYFNGNFTVTTWARETAFNVMSRLFDFGNGPANNNVLACMSNGTTGTFFGEIYYNNYSGGKIISPASIPLNEWVHLAFVYESGQIRLYKNGELWRSGSSYYTPQNVVRTINYIARSNWATDGYYQGSFDDFRIYNYALDETEIDNVYSYQSLWLTGEILQDTLEPGASLVTEIGINASDLFAGSYSGQIVLSSNDPLNPTMIIPVFLTVNGQPQGEIQAGPLQFDTIMQYTVTESYFKLYNHGCDSLYIYNYFCSIPEFTIPVLVETPYILPGDSVGIPVYFHPQDTGYFEGIITLETNDGVFNITVEGYASGAPGIGFNPESLTANFQECDQSSIQNLTLSNTGLTDLTWQANAGSGAGTALGFSDYGQWVSLGNLGAMPDQGTIEFWQWSSALVNYNNSFCTNGLGYYQGNKGIRFEENQYGEFGVVFGDDNSNYSGYNLTYNLPINSWHHIAVGWDKNSNQVWTYFDGNVVVEGDYCDNWATQWTEAYIGVGWADWRWWNGMIDEFRIWNTIRTQAEIQNYMTKSFSGNESGLIAYWDMNEGSGNTVYDKTPNNHDGNFSGAAWSESEAPIQSFVTVDPTSGTLAPGAEIILQVGFNGTGYNSGNHPGEIGFLTNDPQHLSSVYPVSMIIDGNPEITVIPAELNFGDVMQNTSKTDSLLVKNTGCKELIISEVIPFSTVFTFPEIPMTIPPHDSAYLKIVFGSPDVANYWDIFTLLTNDENVDLTLEGNSVSSPHIVADPSYIDVWVPCNDSVMVPVTLTNEGGNELFFQIGEINVSAGSGTPLQPECSPNAYNHCCDIGTYRVNLEDIDNHTQANSGLYSDYSADQRTFLSIGSTYTINIETSPDYDMDAYAWIDYNNNTIFEEGELIMNSQDMFIYHSASFTVPDWAVKNVPLRLRVGSDYYGSDWLTSCNQPNYGEYEDYTILIQTILTLQIPQNTVAPGESVILEAWFNAAGLLTGDYYPSFTLLTNDPLNPVVQIQSYMNVYGASGFTTDLQQLDFGDVMLGTLKEIPFTITNTGCNTLEVYDAFAIDPVFKLGPLAFMLEPGADTTIMIGFETWWTGYAETDLYFITNIGDQVFPATATGIPAPNIWLDFTWIDADFYCGQTFSTTYTIFNDADGTGSFYIEPATTVTRDLQMQYHFTGNTADSSGKGRDLINNEASFVYGHTGNPDEALYFSNGAGLSYNNTADLTSMLYPDGLSVSFWTLINYDYASQDPTPCLMNVGGSPSDDAGLRIYLENDSVKARVVVNNIAYSIGYPIIWDEFFMVSATFDWYNLHLFINGNYVGEVYTEGSMTLDPDYNKIGIGYNNSVPGDEHYFTGTIDEVNIFNRSLWWEELILMYNHFTRYSEIQFDPPSGTLDPYSTQGLTTIITTDSASTGEYINFYHLVTNDPDQPRSLFAINTFIDGWPDIVINTPEIQFDTTLQYTQRVDSVLIENPSCSILYIWYMYTDSPNFYPLSSYTDMNETIEIAPHSSRYVYVAFNPQETGYLTDNLHLGNDVNGENIVPLSGYGKEIPIISVDPGTINTYLSCVDSRTEYLNITNTGVAELTFNLEFEQVVEWMTASTMDGTVAPGETITIELYFNRGTLPLALYTNLIKIFSNDPYHGYMEVPVFILIPNPLVGVDLGADVTFCEGSAAVLSAGNYSTYLWNDGSTGNSLTVSTPGTYWVDVLDFYDCPSTDTIVVSSIAYPIVTSIADTTLCANGTVQLDAVILNTIPPQQIQAVIGSGTAYSTETGPNPFGTYYMDHRVQLLYKSSELLSSGITAGNITAIGFILNGVGNPGMNGLNIKIGTTNLTSLNGFVSGLTNVYSVSYYYPHVGQNVFTLNLPYFWNGSSNLIVEVCFDNASWVSNSSFQYTSISGSVWGNYCDNCNSGCNLTGGASYANRANLVIHGDGDKSRYLWTGPASYQALYRNPVVSNIQTNQSGWYHLTVNNGFDCFGYDSTYVTVLPTPSANAGPDLNILGYDSTLIAANVSGGVPPYTIGWSPITDLNDPGLLQPMARPLSTRTYTLTINGENGCSHSDAVTINVTPRYSISGQVIYNNAYYSSLPGVKVRLKNAAQVPVDSTETDIGGNYIFPLNINGTYSIDAFSTAESGGVNSTDALGIAKHSVFLSTLTGLRLTAADVNAGQTVTAADALLVLHRTVGNISTFPAGDWVFEKKTFALNGSNIGIDLYGLSTGDVNGSFIPYAKLENSVELQYSGILQLPPDESVWVPVYLSETTQTGAVTIGLNFNADLIGVEGIQSSLPDLVYAVRDGEIRIAWSKTEGYPISREIPMFEILVKRKSGGVLNETPLFTCMNICEIAGPDEAVIPGRNLMMPKLLAAESLTGGFYLGQNRPNPAEENTTIPFMLPEEGMVTISLLNPVGSEINCLIHTQFPAGSHNITTDCSHLAAGVYIYRLRFENGNTRYSQSRRMVISK